jgi:hypothetical protein
MQDHDQHRRQHGEHGRGHHHVPLGTASTAPDHLRDADRRPCTCSRRSSTSSGREILVPAVDEQDDEQRRDVGPASGSRMSSKKRIGPAPSISGGLDEFVGDGEEELAEQQRRGGRGDQRHGQAGDSVSSMPRSAMTS